jgi:phosphonate transport system ATP-binding protein
VLPRAPFQSSTPLPFLGLQDLGVTYSNGSVALRGVDLEFPTGTFVALLGPSGSGKSTLLRCINLLVSPSTGGVHCAGLPVLPGRSLQSHRLRTGMIFQQHQLNPRQTVLQNVLNGRLGRYGWWRTLLPFPKADQLFALRCLERVGLLDKALSRADQLSGGQQQRVGIARALAQEPKIILADEPVASLDPAGAQAFLELLRGICKEDGILVLMSLHQVALARAYGDRIIGLREGRVVFDGPPSDLDAMGLEQVYGPQAEAVETSPQVTPHGAIPALMSLAPDSWTA